MKFPTTICRCGAKMYVQNGRRGYFYRCSKCKRTINNPQLKRAG